MPQPPTHQPLPSTASALPSQKAKPPRRPSPKSTRPASPAKTARSTPFSASTTITRWPRLRASTTWPRKASRCPKLAGVPFGIKDVLTLEGFAATAGSKILEGYRPPYTATAVKKLADAGAIFLGKLNCDEFAMGSSNENSAYGPVHNPHALDRVPGGSSGGSAAAVAAGMAVATLGTDTGGSIRQPASFCGVVGVLPTYGRVSRYGLIAFASSLDRIGPFAASVRDAATVLGVIAGHDVMDATSSPLPVPDYTANLDQRRQGHEARRSRRILRRRPRS